MTETEETTSKQSDGLSLSATQLLGSVLAAVSASLAASVFGVAGTVIGAALGSLISVVGSAVYSYSLRRTQERVRSTLDLAVARRFDVRGPAGANRTADSLPVEPTTGGASPEESAGSRWRRVLTLRPKQFGLAAAALFVLTLVLITGFELVSGRPVSATVTDKQGSGVSLIGGHTAKPSHSNPPASPSSSPTGSTTSAAVSASPSATPSTSPSASESSAVPTSTAPSNTPSASDTPTSAPPAPTQSAPAHSAPAASSPAGLETPAPTAAGTGG